MGKLFKALTGIATVAAAGVAAKLCYDYFKNQEVLQQEAELFSNLVGEAILLLWEYFVVEKGAEGQ